MVVLVLGFGPFGSVVDNPARRLALAVDGADLGGVRIVGREMPVSYARSEALTLAAARETGARLVLGVGVATKRTAAELEAVARNVRLVADADVDGVSLSDHGPGPEALGSPLAAPLAACLGVALSEDAGGYVCNGWLYRALRAGLPAAFLHVPPDGFPPERLVAGLGQALRALPAG